MSGSQIDIVARLQLRAEQFSSETGARFAEMKTRAQSSATEVRNAFTSSFAEVQKLAAGALKLPRTTAGSLDLSGEIASLTAASTAADQRAISLRELSIAQTAVATAGRGNIEALRLEADASAVAALAAERDASAIRERIGTLTQVQAELGRGRSATAQHTAAMEASAAASADYAVRADRLLNSLDPVRAAQQRANAELAEARQLMDAGHLTADQYAQAQDRAALSLRSVADAAGVAAEKQRALYLEQASAAREQAGQNRSQTAFASFTAPTLSNKSARDSASVFEDQARAAVHLEERVTSLRTSIDPLWAAQQRYNTAQAEARDLMARGAIGLDEYSKREVQLQSDLRYTTEAINQHTASGEAGRVSDGQRRAALQQLGFQLNDVATSYMGGAKVSMIFAQQTGQVIQALQMMTNKTTGLLGWLGGPWGAVFAAATIVAVPLIAKMFEMNNALDDAVAKLKKEAAETEISRQAKEKYTHTIEGQIDAQKRMNDELERSVTTQRQQQQFTLFSAQKLVDEQRTSRPKLVTDIAGKQAEVADYRKRVASFANDPQSLGATLAVDRLAKAGTALAKLKKQLADLDASIVTGERSMRQAQQPLLANDVEASLDKKTAAALRYTKQMALLNVQLGIGAGKKGSSNEQQADGSFKTVAVDGISAEQYRRALLRITKERDAAVKAAQDADRAAQSAARAGPLTNFLAPVSGRVTGNFGESRPGHTHAGIDYAVPVGTPVRAPAAGTVDVAGQRSGYGNAIYINFGGGTSARFGHLSKFNVKPGDTVNAGDVIGYSGGAPGADGSGRSTGAHLHYEVRRNGRAVDPRKGAFPTDAGRAGDDAQRQADKIAKANEQAADRAEQASRAIAAVNAQWDEQPRLIDRAAIESAKLTDIIKDYDGKPDAASQAIVANAKTALQTIQAGMTRPFDDYVKSQREAVGVQQLALQGREAEAAALSVALGIQRQMGPLSDAQLATIVQIERHQQAIADAIEDQRRVVGLYSGAVGNLQQRFEGFLDGLRTKPGAALQDLVGGFVDEFSQLQNRLLSEQLFGGMQREMERYVAQRMGGTTPSDLLKEQIGDAGTVLDRHTDDVGTALDDMVKSLRGAIDRINGLDPRAVSAAGAAVGANLGGSTITPISDLLTSGLKIDIAALPTGAANDNDIVVTARKDMVDALKGNTTAQMTAAEFFNHAGRDMAGRLEKITGIKIPDALKNGFGTVMQGASNGQLGGSVFASITGGKNNALASSIGGVLGQEAGKAMSKPIGDLIGGTLGKTLGGAAGPLGAIAGGILGNVIGGLFKKSTQASSTITFGADGLGAGAAVGNGTAEKAAASASANSVVGSINRIAEALGGTVTGAGSVSIGYRPNHKAPAYRVDTSGTGKLTGGTILAFATEEEAVRAAIAEALKDGVVGGISDASKRILAAGGDLEKAITKASLIEAVPKDLKAMLDPVGAAVDELNRKFQQTVDALKEGGASAEQMAQAEQLYNLQLDQTKASAQSASSSLKDFLTALKVGTNSPYSLRDQEATAKAGLQPYLDQINAGQAIDQSKYQSAAQTFLDVERQLYGSTQSYFDALDQVQASTNKAISTIDNAKPITTSVESPFAKATADSAAATASAVETGNQMTEDTNSLLARIATRLDELGNDNSSSDFVGTKRGFA